MVYWILIVCAAIALVAYVREKVKAYSLKAVLIKSVVSVLFIAVGVYGLHVSAASGGANPIGVLVVMGLVCGLLGDIWLDLKYVFPEQDLVFTYAGFAVFGIGHVLYIAGMLVRFYPPGGMLHVLVPIVLGIVLSVVNALKSEHGSEHNSRWVSRGVNPRAFVPLDLALHFHHFGNGRFKLGIILSSFFVPSAEKRLYQPHGESFEKPAVGQVVL